MGPGGGGGGGGGRMEGPGRMDNRTGGYMLAAVHLVGRGRVLFIMLAAVQNHEKPPGYCKEKIKMVFHNYGA